MIEPYVFVLAFLGGLLPAMIWLFFWLREDKAHPEPNKYLIRTFLLGMISVPVALGIQLAVNNGLLGYISIETAVHAMPLIGLISVLVLAGTEEIVKYGAAFFGGLKNRKVDEEPVDDVIYMITAALGFAALENALFLFGPLLDGNTELAVITGNMRFIGATLLHVASSAIIGMFRAFSHFKTNRVKKRYLWSGIILATALHGAFNLFIINNADGLFIAFAAVWILILVLLFLFERIKSIHLEQINNV